MAKCGAYLILNPDASTSTHLHAPRVFSTQRAIKLTFHLHPAFLSLFVLRASPGLSSSHAMPSNKQHPRPHHSRIPAGRGHRSPSQSASEFLRHQTPGLKVTQTRSAVPLIIALTEEFRPHHSRLPACRGHRVRSNAIRNQHHQTPFIIMQAPSPVLLIALTNALNARTSKVYNSVQRRSLTFECTTAAGYSKTSPSTSTNGRQHPLASYQDALDGERRLLHANARQTAGAGRVGSR